MPFDTYSEPIRSFVPIDIGRFFSRSIGSRGFNNMRTARRKSGFIQRAVMWGCEELEARSLLNGGRLSSLSASVAEVHTMKHEHARAHAEAVVPSRVPEPGLMRPSSLIFHPLNRRKAPLAVAAHAPYTPAQIRHAYGFDKVSQTGAGQTIAIVAAFDDPTIQADLAVFDATYHIANPPSFTVAFPGGSRPAYDPNWAIEISLDVEWAHVIAPQANILLVESASDVESDLFRGVDYAVASGASQISMSFGESEDSSIRSLDTHLNHPGVSFFAPAGDNGTEAEYPASSPYVTSVGGTSLTINSAGNRISEIAWSKSGGAASSFEPLPRYQSGFVKGKMRGVPDVAYNADPGNGYSVYDSSDGHSGWWVVGGTSAGPPQWAGLMALVNQGRAALHKATLGTGLPLGTNTALYQLAGRNGYTNPGGAFVDITSGNNGKPAHKGYDLVTGLGVPVANKFVVDMIYYP